jgi:hypothetical protein
MNRVGDWHGPAEALRDRVQEAGGSLTINLPKLGEAFRLRRISRQRRDTIAAALREVGVEVHPSLHGLGNGAFVELRLHPERNGGRVVPPEPTDDVAELRRAHGAGVQRIAELERACAEAIERATAHAGEVEAAREALSLAQARVAAVQSDAEQLAGQLEAARGAASDGANRVARLDGKVSRLSRDLDRARKVAAERADACKELNRDLARAAERIAELEEAHAALTEQVTALARARDEAERETRRVDAELEQLRAAAQRGEEAEGQLAELRTVVKAAEEDAAGAAEAGLRAEMRAKSLQREGERLTGELEAARAAAGEQAERAARLEAELETAGRRADELDQERTLASSRADELAADLENARSALRHVREHADAQVMLVEKELDAPASEAGQPREHAPRGPGADESAGTPEDAAVADGSPANAPPPDAVAANEQDAEASRADAESADPDGSGRLASALDFLGRIVDRTAGPVEELDDDPARKRDGAGAASSR